MSVSSEITRIQNAKTALKNSINAKTDNQHQITTETIDDYADFVDTIQTGGGSSNYNIFVQNSQPSENKGIWIKDNISYDDILINHEKLDYLKTEYGTNLPSTNREMGCVAVGTDIYLFGGQTANNTYSNKVYKFDTLTETYTEVATMPISAYGIGAEYYSGDIYLFGGRNSTTLNTTYKYNVENKTFTQLTNIPYSVGQLGTVIQNDDVYLIGGTSGSTQTANMYKYNITNDNYTQLTSLPTIRNTPAVCLFNNDIYIFGGFSGSALNTSYKYSITNNTYTQLANLPQRVFGANAHVIGDDIYIFGGIDNSAYTACHQYLVNTNHYNSNNYLLLQTGRLSSVVVNDVFYNFGGITTGSGSSLYSDKLQKIFFYNSTSDYTNNNNTLLINVYPFEDKKINLLDNNVSMYINFKNLYFYSTTNGLNKNLTVYYNTGAGWKKNNQ